MHPNSVTGLYWSIRGEVACAEHAPDFEEPRWLCEGWDALPTSSQRVAGKRFQCQHCASDGRAIVRSYNSTAQ